MVTSREGQLSGKAVGEWAISIRSICGRQRLEYMVRDEDEGQYWWKPQKHLRMGM